MFFNGIFGNASSFAEVFVKATPLILTGLGCAVAFRTGFFNIGAEGQFYMGAIAAAAVALNLTGVPGPARIVLSMLAGFICGGLWALIAAIFKAKFGISEIIVTIMLNYIAINFLGIAVRTFLMDPGRHGASVGAHRVFSGVKASYAADTSECRHYYCCCRSHYCVGAYGEDKGRL